MQTVYVYVHLNGAFVPAGVLQSYEEIRMGYSIFQYGRKYLERPDAIAIDPVTLPLSEIEFRTPEWLKMFGAIRDASPDSWGRHVMDKESGKILSEFDYLVGASVDRVGALGFGPDSVSGPQKMGMASNVKLELDLDTLVIAAQDFIEGREIDKRLLSFVEYGSSFGGARPKALAQYNNRSWVAKFKAKDDCRSETRIEYATMLLAKKCGISIPDVKHVTVSSGHDVLLVARFDRKKYDGVVHRKHFVSGLSMLNEHESYVIQIDPEKHSYAALADIIRRYGVQGSIVNDTKEIYRRMIFNIICSNGDDHLRNHGFLYDTKNKGWKLSPCYDVVPDVKPYGMLGLGVGKEGRKASLKNAISDCFKFGLDYDEAKFIIDGICNVSKNWKKHYAECNVPEKDIKALEANFQNIDELAQDKVHGDGPHRFMF